MGAENEMGRSVNGKGRGGKGEKEGIQEREGELKQDVEENIAVILQLSFHQSAY